MNVALILQILNAAVALAGEGSQIYTFLTSVVSRLQAAQAAGTDPTAQDWAYIDQLGAQYLTQLKGYESVTAAILALQPKAPPLADPPPEGTGG